MSTTMTSTEEQPDVRLPRRWDVVVGLLIVAVAIVLAMDPLGGGRTGGTPAEQAASFLAGFDAVSEGLAADRQAVAEAAGEPRDPAGYAALADAIDDARAGYRQLTPPPALARDMESYVAALATEREATLAARDALVAGDDAEAVLRDLLDRRTEANNLQRAVRRTAAALAAGAS